MTDSHTTKITNADFAEAVGYIAKNAAGWATESLTMRDDILKPMRAEPLHRFIADMRDRLTYLEGRANGR